MSDDLKTWAKKSCKELPKGAPAMTAAAVKSALRMLPGWKRNGGAITKQFKFKDFKATMKFVNRVARLADAQNHHPDLAVSYSVCRVSFSTHSVGGISTNDVICAARIESAGW